VVVPTGHRRDADLTIAPESLAACTRAFAALIFCEANPNKVDRAAASCSATMLTAILVYEHPDARSIVEALQPDNTPEIKMKATGNRVKLIVKTNRLRTLIASCDDLLSNLQIAQEMLSGL